MMRMLIFDTNAVAARCIQKEMGYDDSKCELVNNQFVLSDRLLEEKYDVVYIDLASIIDDTVLAEVLSAANRKGTDVMVMTSGHRPVAPLPGVTVVEKDTLITEAANA